MEEVEREVERERGREREVEREREMEARVTSDDSNTIHANLAALTFPCASVVAVAVAKRSAVLKGGFVLVWHKLLRSHLHAVSWSAISSDWG